MLFSVPAEGAPIAAAEAGVCSAPAALPKQLRGQDPEGAARTTVRKGKEICTINTEYKGLARHPTSVTHGHTETYCTPYANCFHHIAHRVLSDSIQYPVWQLCVCGNWQCVFAHAAAYPVAVNGNF